MTGAFLILLLPMLILFYLVWRLWNIKRQLREAVKRIEEIRAENRNQRIRFPEMYLPISELGGSLNRLLDDFNRNHEKLKLLEREHKNMIAHISHDLRTPLTSMLGYIELIQQDQTVGEKERQRYLQIVASKGNSLDLFIREFFELSKLETSDVPFDLSRINISEKIQEVIVTFYQQFQAVHMTPCFQFPSPPVYVWGNAQAIERMFNNLFSNILKYGTDGRTFGVSVWEEDKWVRIDVWDCGRGIPNKDLPYVFERLYRGDTRSKSGSTEGNGLGLAIVKSLAEKQKGSVEVNSIPNEKTCFSVRLQKAL